MSVNRSESSVRRNSLTTKESGGRTTVPDRRTEGASADAAEAREASGSRNYLKSFQNIEPTFRCRPDFVHGMPIARETLRFAFVIPTALFQLKPPLFIATPLLWHVSGPGVR